MGMSRESPPNGTAGLARSRVRGKSLSPAPPASKTPSVSLIAVQTCFCTCSCLGEKAPTSNPAFPPGTLILQALPRGGEYRTLFNQAAHLTLSKMAAPKGKRELPLTHLRRRRLLFWEDCHLGAEVFYRFLLNLYSTPTEMAKLTSFWVIRGA